MALCRDALRSDVDTLLAIGWESGLFSASELQELLGDTLTNFFSGSLGQGHSVRVACLPDNSIAGWSYFSPAMSESAAQVTYELVWIGVSPAYQRRGVGKLLLSDFEGRARERGGDIVIVCTSSTPSTEKARHFYNSCGYSRGTAVVADYYGPGDDKVTFTKVL